MAKLDNEDYDGIAKAVRRSGGGGNSSASTSSSLGSIIPDSMFGSAATAIKKFANVTDQTMNEWRESASKGISLNNDAFGLSAGITKARMTFQEFTDAVEFAQSGFAAIGGTMTESTKLFLKVSTSLSDYDGDKLKMMGIQQGEYNKLLAITMSSSRNLNLEKETDQNKARQSVMAMATEMDKVAKLTGISRQEQEKLLEKQRMDQKWQSTLRNLEAKGVDTTQLKLAQNRAELAGFGDVFKQMTAGGKLSEEAKTKIQFMDEDASIMKSNIESMKSLDETTRKSAFEKSEIDTSAASARFLNDEELNRISSTLDTGFAETIGKVQQAAQDSGMDAIVKIAKERGITIQEAEKIRADIVAKDSKGKTPTGETVTGAATTEALIKVEARITDLRKKQGELIEAGNIAMAKELEKSGAMGKLRELSEPDKQGKPFADTIGGFGEAIDGITKSLREGKFVENIGENIANIFQSGLGGVQTVVANAGEVILNASGVKIEDTGNEPIPIPEGKKPTKLAAGSKETFGDWFKTPKDLIAMLSDGGQPEAVVPEDQQFNFAMDTITKMFSDISTTDQKTQQTEKYKIQLAKLQSADIIPKQNQVEPQLPQPPQQNEPQQMTQTGAVTLKDLNEQLIKLNTVMVKLVSNTNEMVDTSSKQYKATKRLSPNLNA